jgi:UDP-hydrolysing UDP-N-acetyl-D-glucosamine 2-epimerase
VRDRRIAVITTARSEYGLYRPLLCAIRDEPGLELQLVVAASHLDPKFDTIREIEADGFVPTFRIEALLEGDGPGAVAQVMALTGAGVGRALAELAPDIVVALGDRSEMAAAVMAVTPFLIPVAHIAGGATTRGVIDDGFRHAISKLSHLHFPETRAQAERLVRLGEEPWRIHVTGSLSIDNALALEPMNNSEVAAEFGVRIVAPPLIVTLHPETRDFANVAGCADALLAALDDQEGPIVFTYPGADAGGRIIIGRIEDFVRRHPGKAFSVPHLGTRGYFSLMASARAMVGNSSSGLLEAASFQLPVVNIGRRQEGRLAPSNVIHCSFDAKAIRAALSEATSEIFRDSLKMLVNPYGEGNAAARMVAVLGSVMLDDKLLIKADF